MTTQPERPRIGNRVQCTITGIKGSCGWGHKVGEQFEISGHDTAGMCGFFYHDIFPQIIMLQFGGSYPWGDNKDVVRVECLDRVNCVQVELKRLPPS